MCMRGVQKWAHGQSQVQSWEPSVVIHELVESSFQISIIINHVYHNKQCILIEWTPIHHLVLQYLPTNITLTQIVF